MGVKRNPLPGRSWRILAHYKDSSEDIHSREYELKERRNRRAMIGQYPSLKDYESSARRVLDKTCEFDELVLDDWLHLEQMNERAYWMRLGDAYVWIQLPAKGDPIVSIRRGEYGPVSGETEVPA